MPEVPRTFGVSVRCFECNNELQEPGALVFGPPVDDLCQKYHLCLSCWLDWRAWHW